MASESKTFQESEIAAVYNKLKPVEAEFLLGDWTGGDLDTGHAAHKALADLRWAGKSFHSVDNVDPVMVYDEQNNRVWNEKYGHAVVSAYSIVSSSRGFNTSQLREVKFHGVVSTAMIYDQFPIIDHFRYVNDNMVAGAMDTKMYGDAGVYYFFLRRLK